MKFTDVIFISMHVAFVLFPQVMQQQMLGELGTWTAIWCPVVSEMFTPKTNKILLSCSKLLSKMPQMVFGVFVHFNADFMCFDFPM